MMGEDHDTITKKLDQMEKDYETSIKVVDTE